MNRSFLLLLLMLTFSTAFAQQVTCSVPDLKMKPGETATVEFNMENSVDVATAVIVVDIPEGFSFVQVKEWNDDDEEWVYYYSSLTDRKRSKFTIYDNIVNNGRQLRIVITGNGQNFKETSGAITTFNIKADENITSGEFNLSWSEISFGGADRYIFDNFTSKVTVYSEYNVSAATANETMGTVAMPGAGDAVTSGTSLTATATPNPGYNFVNWTAGEEVVSTDNPYSFTAEKDLALVANFKANKYDVTFAYGNGTENTVTSSDFGSIISAPANPTKVGYTFTGWDPEFVEGTTVPVDGITYTAQWQVNQYTITFDVDGGSAIDAITQDYGTAVTTPSSPTRTDYIFDGWDKEIPETMPAENMTIKAIWISLAVTNTIDAINAISEVEYTDECKALIDAAREAYDNLTDDQKALVTAEQYKVLTDAEAAWDKLVASLQKSTLFISDAMYGTFCAPYAVELPEGVTAYTVEGVESNGTTLVMEKVEGKVPANIPVVIYCENPIEQEYILPVVAGTPQKGLLIGVFVDTEISSGYVLQNQNGMVGFYALKGTRTMPANRAYITGSASTDGVGNDNVKAYFFDATTAIKALDSMTEGKTEIYDMTGHKLSRMQKGINIINGVKILVK